MNTPRRFYFIHQSTAVVLMVLWLCILGANFVPERVPHTQIVFCYRGWPLALDLRFQGFDGTPRRMGSAEWKQIMDSPDYSNMHEAMDSIYKEWEFRLIGNIAAAFGILALAGALFEWRLRRREQMDT